ncbi:hypothetical protein H632_c1517p0 [Helicosporidium sp. ATCC 50920]|nr:hypothetical protein H632_c1517p0 [Helicosporidium sp. ATCC 50920]|eukprot:KDD74164.1 hypothetical protein H632_c1517p0 [Helicosporidium sp. ATCC 50920]
MLRSPILPVLAGYLFTYYNSKASDERGAQIDRINDQVRQLYGPLLACVHATRSAYAAMVSQHSPDGTIAGFVYAVRSDPRGAEAEAYRDWMWTVIQPLNERAIGVIVDHVNLFDSPTPDPLFLQYVAHVSAYRVCLKRWDSGALNEWSAVPYPDGLLELVSREFARIKRRQARLLGIRTRQGRERTESLEERVAAGAARIRQRVREAIGSGTEASHKPAKEALGAGPKPRPKL